MSIKPTKTTQRYRRSRRTLQPIPPVGRRGFTFVELVFVGVAASFVATAALPGLTKTTEQAAVASARNEFVGVHRRARAAAIQYGRTAELRIDAAARRIWIEVDTTMARTGERSTIGRVVDLSGSGVRVHATTSSLCFDGNGVAPSRGRCSGSGGFVFSKADHTETVAISATGLVQ